MLVIVNASVRFFLMSYERGLMKCIRDIDKKFIFLNFDLRNVNFIYLHVENKNKCKQQRHSLTVKIFIYAKNKTT